MLRRPIENKNTGPYRKLIINSIGETIINGSELNKEKVNLLIEELENKIKGKTKKEKQEVFEYLSLSESDYLKFLGFLKQCIYFFNLPLPDDKKDYDGNIILQPFERVLRYEDFSFYLTLNSTKHKNIRNNNSKSLIIRHHIRNELDKDIIIKDENETELLIIRGKSDDHPGDFLSINEPYVVCYSCESIEEAMIKNEFFEYEEKDRNFKKQNLSERGLISNGWEFAQHQNHGAQNFFYNTLLDKFSHQLRVDELKSTYWCSECGSLIFTKLFSKINTDSVEIGLSIVPHEGLPKDIIISFPQNFIIYLDNRISDKDLTNSFFIYNSGVASFNLKKCDNTSLYIVDGGKMLKEDIEIDNKTYFKNSLYGGTIIGKIYFDISNKQMKISFNDIESKIIKDINNTFFLELKKDMFLINQLDSLEEYEILKSEIIFNDNSNKDYVGCIIRSDLLSPPIKWTPKRVTFGELKNYQFKRLGIDLMLFYPFEEE